MRIDAYRSLGMALPLSVAVCAACAAGPGTARPVNNSAVLLGSTPQPEAMPEGGDLLGRSTFTDGRSLPWMPLFIEPAKGGSEVKDGAYCFQIERPGEHLWDIQFRHREMTIVKDHSYWVRYSAWSSSPVTIRAKVGMSGAPYTEYWGMASTLGPERQEFSGKFKMWVKDDPTAEFAFHLSDPKARYPVTVCLDDLHLVDPEYTAQSKAKQPAPPPVRVNQIGYFPTGPKRATWVVEGREELARRAVPYELVAADGTVVHRGVTEPFGRDPTSGLLVQRIDFTSYSGSGTGYRLQVRGAGAGKDPDVSDEFAIQEDLLKPLSRDAFRFFYLMRSGIALEQPYVEDPTWARAAGHPTDAKVPCAPDAGCSYTLDASGGWYDAGDYGKYVVNGGISVWLLLDLWEASQRFGWDIVGAHDGDLNIPESHNGTPDLLDEARWELEWMLKMQVPEGRPNAGLVHHKLHDVQWTALGTLPVLDPRNPRELRPVSTAATLNLAATAAQAARIFARFDPEFSRRCLAAARRAYQAAQAHPQLVITAADNGGGGAYEDSRISDERFWAAAELYVTTGAPEYRNAVTKSRFWLKPRAYSEGELPQAMDWRNTDALGTLSLSLDEQRVAAKDREANRHAIVVVAEEYARLSKADGFGQPYAGTHYPWGSNSFMLNNGIVLAFAHAFTHERRFLDGAVASLDYILGRNAVGKSYVSGYGTRPLKNPHHRFWAHAANPEFPSVPPGVVAGGPNSDLQDPYSKGGNLGCIGQTCYFDHVEAYSANEVAINWNAELGWLVAYLEAAM